MSKEIVVPVVLSLQSNNFIDRTLIRAAASGHRTANALSEAVNFLFPPEWCLNRLLEILDDSDILSEINERRLILLNMRDMANDFRKDYDAMRGQKGSAALAKVAFDAQKTIGEAASKGLVNVEEIQLRVGSYMAKVMADSIALAQTKAALELSELYSIPMEKVEEVFIQALPLAVKEIEKNRGE